MKIQFDALFDVLDHQRHSRYFNQTRSLYIARRVRAIAAILAVIQPLWLIVDYFLLPSDALAHVIFARLCCSGLCVALILAPMPCYEFKAAITRLGLLVMILTAFQVFCRELLSHYGLIDNVAGYGFFPYLVMAMMAVFPLAILEVALYAGALLLTELIIWLSHGAALNVSVINTIWLLAVLAMVAGWGAINQLHMLLQLYRQATRDPLTGLSNRRQALEQMGQDFTHAQINGQTVSVMLFDLDKFKRFNDTYGHAAGDVVLRAFAKILQKNARKKQDTVCRYGGEEFLVILPGINITAAESIAEAIIQDCHDTEVDIPGNLKVSFTTSIGLTQLQRGDDLDSCIQRADEALYQAKESGRDQVCIYSDAIPAKRCA